MEKKSGISLDAYIPMDRRKALISGVEIPEAGQGAILFADISGFTQLSSKLTSELGVQRGADEITRYLNLIYGDLINQIHQFNGSVISFAGDAITCWFDQDPGIRALAAGTGIQIATAELVDKHKLPIKIKIVIGSGTAFRFVAGDPNIQLIDLLAGQSILSVVLAEKLAKPGDLLISDEIANAYKSQLTLGRSLTSSNGDRYTIVDSLNETVQEEPWQLDSQLKNEILSQWLLKEVFEKVSQGEERFLAALRLTVSLFLKFDGIDYDTDPESGKKINQFISWVQQSLIRHDGHLLQVIIGDKGNYLYIGFGALTAHEDDHTRAIAAAEILRTASEILPFIKNIQIGISQGRMLAGPYGSPNRRTFSMLGADANVAARLMERAKSGQILMTERVAMAAQSKYSFDPIGALRFKGIDTGIPVFALVGLRNVNQQIQLNQTPLVGRIQELKLLKVYLDQLNQTNAAGIVLLKSEGGTGKTRLLSELMRQIHGTDITILNSFGYEIENSTPYFVVRELFGQLVNSDKYSTKELKNNITELVKEINPEWERLLPLLKEMMSLDYPDNELTLQMHGNIKASNLHNLLIGLFRKISREKTYLIILDDAQWIDAASWALIKELIFALPNTGLIVSSRSFTAEVPKDYHELIESSKTIEIQLTNFDQNEINKLVSQVIGVANLPDEILSLIFERTSGHPFFSEELAYALVESGMIIIEDDECRLVQNLHNLENISVPDTVQSAITSRLDRMTLPQQLSLKVSSILGRLFVFKAVHSIHPSPPEYAMLRHQMDDMTKLNLIALQIVEPDLAFSFKQNIIHDVAYEMLSFDQRHELHQKAAKWYETAYTDNQSQYYSRLGYHWQKAEFFDKAAHYFEKAAYDATSKGAYRDGIVFIEQVLSLESKIELTTQRKAFLYIELGMAHFRIGEIKIATNDLQRGVKLLRKPAPTSALGMGINLMRQSGIQFFNRIKPKSNNRSKPSKSINQDKREILLTISRAYEYLGQAYFHHNKLFFSLDAGLSGLNIAEKAGPSPQLARAYGSLCVTSGTMPIPGLYEEYAGLAKSLLNEKTSLDDHGRILELIAVAYSGKGLWPEIEEHCLKAISMAEEIGDRFLMMENTCILAACKLPQGKMEESLYLRERLLDIGKEDKIELVQGWALLQLAEIALMKEDYSLAEDYLTRALGFEEALGRPDKLWLHGLLAKTYIRLNNQDKALESAGKALGIARQSMPTSFFVLEGYAGILTAYSEIDPGLLNKGILEKRLKQALSSFAKFAASFPIGQPRLLLWKARSAVRQGKMAKARKYQLSGLAKAENLKMVYEIERLKKVLN